MNIFKEGNFNIRCQGKDMADFHNLQSKLKPLTLSFVISPEAHKFASASN